MVDLARADGMRVNLRTRTIHCDDPPTKTIMRRNKSDLGENHDPGRNIHAPA